MYTHVKKISNFDLKLHRNYFTSCGLCTDVGVANDVQNLMNLCYILLFDMTVWEEPAE